MRIRELMNLLLATIASLLLLQPAFGQAAPPEKPGTVFVFNRHTDGFENNAEGFVWHSLGLLDAQGRPGRVQPNGSITDGSGAVLGSVIVDPASNAVVGYRSKDGGTEAYNVSGGWTADQAWLRVAANGTFRIVKHGGSYVDDEAVRHNGGGIMLDNGRTYDGFIDRGSGGRGTDAGYLDPTGTNPSGAYELTPRPGADISLVIDGCYTARDPDGAGDETSVVVSALGVTGAANATGHVPEVIAQIAPNVAGTPAQIAAAQAALFRAAGAANFRNKDGSVDMNNVALWISSVPFADQYAKASAVIAGSGATLLIGYSLAEGGPGPAGDEVIRYGRVTRLGSWSEDAGSYRYGYDEQTDDLTASVLIKAGGLPQDAYLSLLQLPELPVSAPADTLLVSGIFDFRHLGIEIDLGVEALTYEIDVLEGLAADPVPYLLMTSEGGDYRYWSPLKDYLSSPGMMRADSSRIGVVAVFGQVPEPPSILLTATLLLALAGLRRKTASNDAARG